MATTSSELTVRSESVQRLYEHYLGDRFQVNRRYQRKLVWSVEEKRRLIDSLLRDLPVPLFLIAEMVVDNSQVYELIDGMQRLNAIFAFLENEFDVDGCYFDLDALADTKLRKDSGALVQRTPVMDRAQSAEVANYTIALSVYRSSDDASVDDVFRRINSGGRTLSRHSLRQAGTISELADLVRTSASNIRGDTSLKDIVPLSVMPKLSITNYDLDYGVNVEDIYWVREGILRREDVRESLDEQLVLDLMIDCLIDPVGNTGTRPRDAYYDYVPAGSEGPSSQSVIVATAIDAYGAEVIQDHFFKTYDEIRRVLQSQDQRLATLLGAGKGGRAPRYYHAVFLAFFELMFHDRLRIADASAVAESLRNVGAAMNIPGGGGDWQSAAKRKSIDVVKGIIRPAFEGPVDGEDFGRFGLQSYLETILGNAVVEQQLFDCKQGFLTLDEARSFDDGSLRKIARTLAAMANTGKGTTGYVVVGVADTDADASRILKLDEVEVISFRRFQIVGIDRELEHVGVDLNEYWHSLIQRLGNLMPEELKQSVVSGARLVNYKGRAVVLLKVEAANGPVFFEDQLYVRAGSDTLQVPHADYQSIFNRFTDG